MKYPIQCNGNETIASFKKEDARNSSLEDLIALYPELSFIAIDD